MFSATSAFPQWQSPNMAVRIHLDNPHAFYTNLDFISGKVILSLTREENISGIVVKLEGESKTILIRPGQNDNSRNRDRDNIAIENHKILYKINQVFPDTEKNPLAGLTYTLPAGQHEYPFNMKIPFNNGCSHQTTQSMGVGFAGLRIMDVPKQMQYRHVQKTLPPSLSGFPGEAEIRYYVKVTVQRPSMWKENWRHQVGFKFLPIEPPRPPPSTSETYARRSHAFKAGLAQYSKKSSLFKKKPIPLSDTPPAVLVDARFPSPAILTCNAPLPLRIIVKRTNVSTDCLFLVGIQVDLIGYTNVRAIEVQRTESNTWCVMSLNGLSRQIGKPDDKAGTETLIDNTLWNNIKLPQTVTPSFETCNLTRNYEVQIRVILGFGHPGEIQPQTQVLPLSFPVEVFSGIAPPAALLSALAHRPTRKANASAAVPVLSPLSAQPGSSSSSAQIPGYDPLYPPQLAPGEIPAPSGYQPPTVAPGDEAPPSYDDAMADDIAPVDGHRDYSGVTNENGPDITDEKGGARVGKTADSGRLFPDSGPGRRPGNGGGGFVV